MSTRYKIQLDLAGNLIERLKLVEASFENIAKNARAIMALRLPTYGGGGHYRLRNPYPYLPKWALPKLREYHSLTRKYGGNQKSYHALLRDANKAGESFFNFRSNFIRNSFTPFGHRRNIANFFDAILDSGTAILKSNPLLMRSAMFAGGATAVSILPALAGAATYAIGSKALHSTSMTEAISNRMQLNMARQGLGEGYENTYRKASSIAGQYGYSRSGMISMVNTLSGFEINGERLGDKIALDIARITGKVAQLGGRNYDQVGLNMMQLLATDKPNMRDVRELINAAPILSKYALDAMRERGQGTKDPREWLQNRGNMVQALYRLDKEMETPTVSASRGGIRLAKEDFWMNLSTMDNIWKPIGDAGVRMWQMLSDQATRWLKNISPEKIENNLKAFTTILEGLVNAGGLVLTAFGEIANFVSTIINTLTTSNPVPKLNQEHLDKLYNTYADPIINELLSSKEGKKLFGINGNDEEKTNEVRRQLRNVFADAYGAEIGSKASRLMGSQETELLAYSLNKQKESKFQSPYIPQTTFYADTLPNRRFPDIIKSTAQIDKDEVLKLFKDNAKLDALQTPLGGEKTEVEDLTKGSRALTINFNAPIVEMPTTIKESQNPEAILNRIQRNIEEYTVRGLQMALHNATLTI